MPHAESPGIPWQEIAASAYRAYCTVSGRHVIPWVEVDPGERAAWEAAARQSRRCLAIKSAGPVPDETVWVGWRADWQPDSARTPDPGRGGFIRFAAFQFLVALALLAGVIAVTKHKPPSHPPADHAATRDVFTHQTAAIAACNDREHAAAAGHWSAALDCGGDPRVCLAEAAYNLYAAKRYADALAACSRLESADPGNARGTFIRGLISLKQGKPDAARELIRVAALSGDDLAARRLAEGVR